VQFWPLSRQAQVVPTQFPEQQSGDWPGFCTQVPPGGTQQRSVSAPVPTNAPGQVKGSQQSLGTVHGPKAVAQPQTPASHWALSQHSQSPLQPLVKIGMQHMLSYKGAQWPLQQSASVLHWDDLFCRHAHWLSWQLASQHPPAPEQAPPTPLQHTP